MSPIARKGTFFSFFWGFLGPNRGPVAPNLLRGSSSGGGAPKKKISPSRENPRTLQRFLKNRYLKKKLFSPWAYGILLRTPKRARTTDYGVGFTMRSDQNAGPHGGPKWGYGVHSAHQTDRRTHFRSPKNRSSYRDQSYTGGLEALFSIFAMIT